MTRGVEKDAEARAWLDVRFAGAQGENLFLGSVKVVDVEVEVGLLRPLAARPHGRLVVGCELEGEGDIAVAAQLYPFAVGVLDNLPARDGAVERGQDPGVTAVQRQVGESSDGSHARKSPTLPHPLRLEDHLIVVFPVAGVEGPRLR
jgi:hypothetical protein